MDLTTVECTLLAGNRYATPEDFVNDIALVFANAIRFNKDGRDIGDPLSCAYYDASIHLLNYSRWLSLELLSEYELDSDHVDEPEEEGMPPTSWKLTTATKKMARAEMEAIVLKEPIEKSLEGDRYTWMEAECEKLLKTLRHQSDLKYMTFFITPNYPPDYTAFISRPMDWEKVQKSLKKRQYDNFGAIIDDLRLIFSNALKYNSRHAGTDTVSGRAYDSAKFMSSKLEAAINKMMLTVSDRVERERIDHSNAEREIAAAERAEEDRIRAQWKTEAGKDGDAGSAPLNVEASQRIRPNTRIILRKSDTDFEVPFFDEEDDGQHERSYFEVMKQQKATFETQRSELIGMRNTTGGIGQAVYIRLTQREAALKWVADEQKKILAVSPPRKAEGTKGVGSNVNAQASSIMAKLDEKDRSPVKMQVKSKSRKGKRVRPMDWNDEE
jgi:Bromodomain